MSRINSTVESQYLFLFLHFFVIIQHVSLAAINKFPQKKYGKEEFYICLFVCLFVVWPWSIRRYSISFERGEHENLKSWTDKTGERNIRARPSLSGRSFQPEIRGPLTFLKEPVSFHKITDRSGFICRDDSLKCTIVYNIFGTRKYMSGTPVSALNWFVGGVFNRFSSQIFDAFSNYILKPNFFFR